MIFLIRHGTTDANRKFYAGREDIRLNRAGLAQAVALVDEFRETTVDQILSSPLQRAIQTAAPLAEAHGVDIQLCQQLSELDFGVMQGLPKADHQVVLRRQHLYTPVQGGESLSDLWHRLHQVCTQLVDTVKSDKTIVVVGHYWSNRLLFGRLTGCSLEEAVRLRNYRPSPGSLVAIEHLSPIN